MQKLPLLGQGAGYNVTTGSFNIAIGCNAILSAVGVNNEIVLGCNLTGKGTRTFFVGSDLGVYHGGNTTTWSTVSDQRIKKNIGDYTVGLEVMRQLRVRNFEYRAPEEITELSEHSAINKEGLQTGLIAQELQQVLPKAVTEQSTGVLSVNTDEIFWNMINAIKELDAENQELKAEIAAIKAHVGITTN